MRDLSDSSLNKWLPDALETKYEALDRQGAIVIAIPSADRLIEAVEDVRALLGEDRPKPHLVFIDDPVQWNLGDDDDFVTVMDFPPEWRHEPDVGVQWLINQRKERHIIVPLADPETLSFVSEASMSTINCWCFVVADTFGEVASQLAQSNSYVDIGGMNDVSVLMWPFKEGAQIDDDGSWRGILRSKLQMKDATYRARWPLAAISEEDFNRVLDAALASDAEQQRLWAQQRETNSGRAVSTFGEADSVEASPETDRMFALLESLHPYALVELRTLVRLGFGREGDTSWPTVLGKSFRDIVRATRKPSDFVGGTVNFSKTLINGLRIARELAV